MSRPLGRGNQVGRGDSGWFDWGQWIGSSKASVDYEIEIG